MLEEPTAQVRVDLVDLVLWNYLISYRFVLLEKSLTQMGKAGAERRAERFLLGTRGSHIRRAQKKRGAEASRPAEKRSADRTVAEADEADMEAAIRRCPHAVNPNARALISGSMTPMSGPQSTVRVLVSYTQEAAGHKDRCRELTDRLRDDGIDAWIDQYVPAPPEGWPRWMQQQITASDFVLLVCTPTFRRRFEGTESHGVGPGATWEGLIATQVLYDSGARNEKLVPVTFADATADAVPTVLRPFTRYRLWAEYDGLYRHLTGQPAIVPPPVAARKVMSPLGRTTSANPTSASDPAPASPPMPPGTEPVLRARDRMQALYELLLFLFDASELRMWLRFSAEGETVVRMLPGESTNKADLVFKATDLLSRRGLVDAELFDRLRDHLPRQAAVIDHVRAHWLGP